MPVLARCGQSKSAPLVESRSAGTGVVQKVTFLVDTDNVNFGWFAYDSTDSHPKKPDFEPRRKFIIPWPIQAKSDRPLARNKISVHELIQHLGNLSTRAEIHVITRATRVAAAG